MHDGNVVVEEARNDMMNVFSTMRNVLINEQTNEDEFHSIMADLINKFITLYQDHSARPLGPVDYQIIVDRYNYIGWVRKKQDKLAEAWTNHEQALRILREHLPPTHPRLAITYNHIALLHSTMNDHLSALDYLKKAPDIQEKALQPNHPHLAETHFQLSIIFERLNQIDEAFQHAKRAIDIARQVFLKSSDSHIKQYQEQFDKILLLSQSFNELVL